MDVKADAAKTIKPNNRRSKGTVSWSFDAIKIFKTDEKIMLYTTQTVKG